MKNNTNNNNDNENSDDDDDDNNMNKIKYVKTICSAHGLFIKKPRCTAKSIQRSSDVAHYHLISHSNRIPALTSGLIIVKTDDFKKWRDCISENAWPLKALWLPTRYIAYNTNQQSPIASALLYKYKICHKVVPHRAPFINLLGNQRWNESTIWSAHFQLSYSISARFRVLWQSDDVRRFGF